MSLTSLLLEDDVDVDDDVVDDDVATPIDMEVLTAGGEGEVCMM